MYNTRFLLKNLMSTNSIATTNFFARNVSYTFLEMFFSSQNTVCMVLDAISEGQNYHPTLTVILCIPCQSQCMIYDTCHEKIDPFSVQNRVIYELSW